MEITSALNSGLQGFQNARLAADQAAADIVASTGVSTEQAGVSTQGNEVNTEVNNPNNHSELPDLNQAIVSLKVAEFQAKSFNRSD